MTLSFRLLLQEDAQCLPGPRSSTPVCYWRLLWNWLRLIRKVRGQPAKSISLTWRYLIYPGVSRGMRKNIVVLSGVSQLRLAVDPPQLALLVSCQAAAVPLRQPCLCLSPGSDLPRQKQQQLSAVSLPSAPPLLKCRVDQLPQVVFKPLAALHKTLPWTVFVCVFVRVCICVNGGLAVTKWS